MTLLYTIPLELTLHSPERMGIRRRETVQQNHHFEWSIVLGVNCYRLIVVSYSCAAVFHLDLSMITTQEVYDERPEIETRIRKLIPRQNPYVTNHVSIRYIASRLDFDIPPLSSPIAMTRTPSNPTSSQSTPTLPPNLPPSYHVLLQKQQEHAGLQALKEASAEMLQRVEKLAEMSNVMADGGESGS